jgi:hypothetical protein
MQDKVDLVTWVEGLPKRENLAGYDEVLKSCAERYGNKPPDLAMILDCYLDMFRATMAKQIQAFRQHHVPEGMKPSLIIPGPTELNEIFEASMKATLLRMWTYASEYYQRYRADDFVKSMTLTDDILGQLLSTPEEEDTPNES